MATVDEVVESYKAAARRADGTPLELEVRFDTTDFPFLETVVSEMLALVAGGCFTVAHSRTMNTIRPVTVTGDHRTRNREHGQKSQNYIWERKFVDRTRREDSYVIKTRVGIPAKVRPSPLSAGYKVVFSTEMPTSKFALESLLFRLKNRLSFEPAAGAPCELATALAGWRLDVTVVRELADASSGSLKPVASALFGLDPAAPEQTPATLLSQLGLTGGSEFIPTATLLANRRQYQYSVELEYVGDPEALTPAGLQLAVSRVLHLSNPTFHIETQVQNTLREAAAHVYKASAMLQKFATGVWGLKQLGPAAIAPTRSQYAAMYPPVDYYVTDKAHGIRALASVGAGRLALVAPGIEAYGEGFLAYEEVCLEGVGKPTVESARMVPAGAAEKTGPVTILEGELVPAPDAPAVGGRPFPLQFLAYDCIAAYGNELADKPFEERVQALSGAAEAVAAFGLVCSVKPFVHLSDSSPKVLGQQFETLYSGKGRKPPRNYEVDGLVLYAPGEPYASTAVYKWKPLEETTNDFLARRPPSSVLGHPPYLERPGYELYFLFVGISLEQFQSLGMNYCPGYDVLFGGLARESGAYFPVQFQPSDQPYAYLYYHPIGGETVENHIIELRLAAAAGADGFDLPVRTAAGKPTGQTVATVAPHWELVRVRTDRQEDLLKGRLFGNNFTTAERNWLNYRDPLTLEMLGAGPGPSYFAGAKAGIYKAMTSFVSFCKSNLVRAHLGGLGWVVDLGAGKGQDMFRYREAQVRAAVMVDESQPALAELVRRKLEGKTRRGRGERATQVHVVKASFLEPYQEFVQRIRAIPQFPAEGADAVVCNLAAHYAFGTRESMVNFALILRELVRPGGQVILTLMDGSRVQDLLDGMPVGGRWSAREGDALKYAIERQYREPKLTPAGQKINVLLPFSDGQLYEEYLSNIGELNKVMTRRGFSLGQYEWLWDRYESGFRTQKQNYAALTPADRTWLSLFAAVRYVRQAE